MLQSAGNAATYEARIIPHRLLRLAVVRWQFALNLSSKNLSSRAKAGSSWSKRKTRAIRGVLEFVLGHIDRVLPNAGFAGLLGAITRVYVIAVLEFLASEMLQSAGNAAAYETRVIPHGLPRLAVVCWQFVFKLSSNNLSSRTNAGTS
ncbi:histone H2A-like [Ornithodoros turicata]|uniref:histone H2A-like n=1 Tax=Ornithodoros turicata TaxID=34597 RepID=UPI0031390DF6